MRPPNQCARLGALQDSHWAPPFVQDSQDHPWVSRRPPGSPSGPVATTGDSWAPFLHLSPGLKQSLVAAVPTKGGGGNQVQARPTRGL